MKAKKSVNRNTLLANIMNYELKWNYYSAVHHNSCGGVQGYDVDEYVEKTFIQFQKNQFVKSPLISGLYFMIHAFIYLYIYLIY